MPAPLAAEIEPLACCSMEPDEDAISSRREVAASSLRMRRVSGSSADKAILVASGEKWSASPAIVWTIGVDEGITLDVNVCGVEVDRSYEYNTF